MKIKTGSGNESHCRATATRASNKSLPKKKKIFSKKKHKNPVQRPAEVNTIKSDEQTPGVECTRNVVVLVKITATTRCKRSAQLSYSHLTT